MDERWQQIYAASDSALRVAALLRAAADELPSTRGIDRAGLLELAEDHKDRGRRLAAFLGRCGDCEGEPLNPCVWADGAEHEPDDYHPSRYARVTRKGLIPEFTVKVTE